MTAKRLPCREITSNFLDVSKSEALIYIKLPPKDVLMQKKSGFYIFAWGWANFHRAGRWTEPGRFPFACDWVRVAAGEGGPLRTNINLLQQSIFHHTHSQGTSQSGLYPFCQWLPSSISFIENYIPDRWRSRPLSICRRRFRRGDRRVAACSQKSDR